MTDTPASDLIARIRWAALNDKKLHLDVELVQWMAQHFDLQAVLTRDATEETAKRCRAKKIETEDGHGLPLFQARESSAATATPSAAASPASSGSIRSTSTSARSDSPTSSAGMTPALVQNAASLQALDQAQRLKSQSKRAKRLRHTSPPTPARQPRRPRPTLASQTC